MVRFAFLPIIVFLLFSSCGHEVPSSSEQVYHSQLLQRDVEYLVLLPKEYHPKKQRYPVLYLLHCAGCTHYSYIEHYPHLQIGDLLNYIIVIPFDGTTTGWWLDSPVDSLSQLSKWLSKEFKVHIDSHYATLPDRNNTGIAGHSMGGYGALLNYIKHFDVYGHAFSAKGVIEIAEHKGAYGITSVLGSYESGEELYKTADLTSLIHKLAGKHTNIRFYSGENDWFTNENRRFDSLLTALKLHHDYFESEEPHQSMSFQSIWKMHRFFDSSFLRTPDN